MAERAFIDSNIWIHGLLARPQHREKTAIARQITVPGTIVSTQVISEVCNVLIKKAAFAESQIKELIAGFYDDCIIVSLDQQTFESASELRGRYSLSYWDSMIVACAIAAEADVLYSEDMHAGLKIGKMRIENPFHTP